MNCNLSIHIRSFLVCTLLLAGCTDKDAPGIEEVATIPLQLMVNTAHEMEVSTLILPMAIAGIVRMRGMRIPILYSMYLARSKV